MVERIADLPDNVLGFRGRGKVTGEDYEKVIIPAVEREFSRRDKVSFLCHLDEDFTGIEPSAVWDDTKIGFRHFSGWERMAVVTDVDWIRAAVKLFGLAIPGRVRVFRNKDFAEAKRWITEPRTAAA